MSVQTLQFRIVSPERVVYEDQVDSVSIMTAMGEITVLPGHIPLLGLVKPGELIVRKDGEVQYLSVLGGFVEVHGDNALTILADAAERVDEIDVERAEAARDRAKKALEEKQFANDIEFAALQAALERSMTRVKVARRRKRL